MRDIDVGYEKCHMGRSVLPLLQEEKTNVCADDPELWHGAPIGLQLVGRNLDEERLLAVSAVVDDVVNRDSGQRQTTPNGSSKL